MLINDSATGTESENLLNDPIEQVRGSQSKNFYVRGRKVSEIMSYMHDTQGVKKN